MSLFASNETVKIYIDKNGNISKKETEDWVEVPVEITAELRELALKVLKNSKVEVKRDGNAIVDLGSLSAVPYDFLVKAIKSWSEAVPITKENLFKLNAKVLENIWRHLQEMYNLGGVNAI